MIIPTFNRAHTLPRAIDSVFNQDYFIHEMILHETIVHEVIVVDDGSRDNTACIVQNQYPRVKFLRQENRGVSAARNRGIRAATGNWIALLDSDDSWAPRKLSRQAEAIAGHPDALLCHSDEIWIRNGVRINPGEIHRKRGGYIFQYCLPRCVISPSSVLIKKQLFEEMGYFDETLPVCEDYDLWLRVCAKYPVLYIDECLITKYGGHEDQLSRKYWGMDRFRVQALEKCLRDGAVKGADKKAVSALLRYKCEILTKGALKYQNQKILADCEAIIKRNRSQVELTK